MQGGAPGRSANDTQTDLNEWAIYPIFQPAFSSDLNPIETVWDRIKDYVERTLPQGIIPQLRQAVKEAWELSS
jgi:transposase